MIRIRSTRLTSVAALTSLFLLAFSGLVLAQNQTDDAFVLTGVPDPDRNLELLNVAGDPLESVALRPGVPNPFQVRVTDEDIDLLGGDAPFHVQATLNNLYTASDDGEGGVDVDVAGDFIPSSKVTLDYATNPLGASNVLADIDLRYLVGSGTPIDCGRVSSLLGLSLAQQALDPICGLLSVLTGSATTITGVEVESSLGLVDTLLDDVLALTELPMQLSNPAGGTFGTADCVNGLGKDDLRCAGQAGSARTVLVGNPDATQELLDLLQSLAGRALLVGSPEAAATVDDVIRALRDQGGDALSLADRIASSAYTEAQRITLINGLLSSLTPVADLGLQDLLLSGEYRSLPTLEVDTSEAPNGGRYAGTLTVTLFEGSIE